MNTQSLTAVLPPILDKIKAYDRIIIFRHIRPDGDCMGASKGLARILQLTYPSKEIYLPQSDTSDYLAFLGADDPALPDDAYHGALGIVVDTGSADRISNPKYTLCAELVKIDHHPDRDAYAALAWVDDTRASCSEMIADFQAFFASELQLDTQAATLLYLGIVTDSGRFRYPDVSGDTLRTAAYLMDAGVDAQQLYARLYLRDEKSLRFQSYVYEHMQIMPNGAAYLHIDEQTRQRFDLSLEDASASVSYLDSIRGVLCWVAFIDQPDGSIRVRLRSRFAVINDIAERYHGGGHAFASGATVYSIDEMHALMAEADERVKTYKAQHDDWL